MNDQREELAGDLHMHLQARTVRGSSGPRCSRSPHRSDIPWSLRLSVGNLVNQGFLYFQSILEIVYPFRSFRGLSGRVTFDRHVKEPIKW